MNTKQMKLGMFLRPAGHHVAAWRHPDAQVDAGWNFTRFAQLAHTAERGFFAYLNAVHFKRITASAGSRAVPKARRMRLDRCP
jgi:hypothetical protein